MEFIIKVKRLFLLKHKIKNTNVILQAHAIQLTSVICSTTARKKTINVYFLKDGYLYTKSSLLQTKHNKDFYCLLDIAISNNTSEFATALSEFSVCAFNNTPICKSKTSFHETQLNECTQFFTLKRILPSSSLQIFICQLYSFAISLLPKHHTHIITLRHSWDFLKNKRIIFTYCVCVMCHCYVLVAALLKYFQKKYVFVVIDHVAHIFSGIC